MSKVFANQRLEPMPSSRGGNITTCHMLMSRSSGDPKGRLNFPGDHGCLPSWARADDQEKCLHFLMSRESSVKQLSRPPCLEVAPGVGG